MPRIDTKLADVAADETIEGGEDVTTDETIESGEGGEGGDATLTLAFADQEPIVEGITLADLTLFSCRWPIGNPHDLTTFRYCGEAAPCGPYCKRHARLAYLNRKT
jgi:hypothetical protein